MIIGPATPVALSARLVRATWPSPSLADLGSLLLVIGLTGPLLQPLLALRVVQKLRFLAYPVVAFTLWALDLCVWHLPVLYQASISSDLVHALQHTSFVFFGFTMWLALLGPLPQPAWFGNGAKLAYVVAVRLTGTLLANVFMWAEVVFYPDYRSGQLEWKIGALADQGLAGTIMMIEGSLVPSAAGLAVSKAARNSASARIQEFASATVSPDRAAGRSRGGAGARRGAEARVEAAAPPSRLIRALCLDAWCGLAGRSCDSDSETPRLSCVDAQHRERSCARGSPHSPRATRQGGALLRQCATSTRPAITRQRSPARFFKRSSVPASGHVDDEPGLARSHRSR